MGNKPDAGRMPFRTWFEFGLTTDRAFVNIDIGPAHLRSSCKTRSRPKCGRTGILLARPSRFNDLLRYILPYL